MTRMSRLRSLSVEVATGRVAAVFLENNEVIAAKLSRQAAQDPESARRILGSWIRGFGPDHMMIEDPKLALRKGEKSREISQALAELFAETRGLDMRLPRHQVYQNKYDEAQALAERYPAMQRWLPKRPPIWMPEPRNMSYFEALSLVDQLTSG